MPCHSKILRPRRGAASRWIIAAVVIVVVLLGLIGLRRWVGPGLPECKPDDLAAARERWAAANVGDYDIGIRLSGRQSGEIKVEVRNGRPTSMTRNGVQPKQERTWEPWTVPGMFETLDIDFDNRAHATEKFGTTPESVHMRCEFDAVFGYPKHYLHQVYGRQQDLEWVVTEFVKR